MKNINKIVIFDWGGVIENNNTEEYTTKKAIIDIMKRYNCTLSNEEIFNICSNGKKLYDTFVNDDEEVTKKWFEEIKSKLNINCTYEEYKKAYYKYGKKIPYHRNVVRYAHSLNKKCKIAIFSSLVKLDYNRINDQVNLSKFDYIFLTYKMGYNKPNKKTFEIIENTTKIRPENILFIDDTKINIEVAQQRGWNACNANGYELDKIKKAVEIFLNSSESIPKDDRIISDTRVRLLENRITEKKIRLGWDVPNLELKPYKNGNQDEIEFIYDLKKEVYKEYVEKTYGEWIEENQQKIFARFMKENSKNIELIYLKDELVGFYNGKDKDNNIFEIGNICVKPEYQNKGIGTAVLKEILFENKHKEIRLQCFKDNPAIELYKRLGFEKIDETETHYIMKK